MPKEIEGEKRRKIEVLEESPIPSYFFEEIGEYKDAKLFICRVEDILRPITVILPVEEAVPEKIREKVEEEVKRIEEARKAPLPPYTI